MSQAAARVLITIGEAARMLDCPNGHVLELARAGRLQIIDIDAGTTPDLPRRPGKPRSKHWRVGEADVRAFIQSGLGYIQPAAEQGGAPEKPRPARKAGERYRFR
jgi:hypothetical protein